MVRTKREKVDSDNDYVDPIPISLKQPVRTTTNIICESRLIALLVLCRARPHSANIILCTRTPMEMRSLRQYLAESILEESFVGFDLQYCIPTIRFLGILKGLDSSYLTDSHKMSIHYYFFFRTECLFYIVYNILKPPPMIGPSQCSIFFRHSKFFETTTKSQCGFFRRIPRRFLLFRPR